MIVFKYKAATDVAMCHQLLQEMEIPGEPVTEDLGEIP
jgi:hypothetical protein